MFVAEERKVLVVDTDNEHRRLRRRVASRLGRTVSDAAWEFAKRQHYVEEALDPEYRAEDQLVDFLRDALRVTDPPPSRAGLRRRKATPDTDSDYLAARIDALSRLAADAAAGDAAILAFRSQTLGLVRPFSADEAEAYLERPEARAVGSRAGAGRLEILEYQNRRIYHTIHVETGSALAKLRRLAATLSESYPWKPQQAAAFVLEGLTPQATPFTLQLQQWRHDNRPKRTRVVMEVDLWMPAERVMQAYRELQRQVLPGHNRPLSLRTLELVSFVMRKRPASWPQLLRQWNNEHPVETYHDYRQLRYAFDRARASLADPQYRTYVGRGS